MKQRLFLPSLLCLILIAPTCFGQRVKVNPQSATGTFRIASANAAAVDARYSIRPAAPDNIVLVIAPQGEFNLDAHIIDTRGREVAKIPSQRVNLRYANSIDISKLAPGNYFIEMMNAGTRGYNIPFTVASKTASSSLSPAKKQQ